MRHKHELKNRVRYYRRKGLSLGDIHQITQVPRSTIRTWIKDISLSPDQIDALSDRVQKALQKGRVKYQKTEKDRRIKNETYLINNGTREIGKLSKRELLIAAISLYWAEGFKNRHEHRLGFCNSDPHMIKFYVYWLKKQMRIKRDRLVARLTLNSLYKNKVTQMEKFWSEITGIPLNQFTKPFFQTSIWKKQYDIENYHGVLRVHVKDSLNQLLKMRGWIEGLKMLK